MLGLKVFTACIALLICAPLWFYLVYRILVAINADELTWFIYWTYVPVTVLVKLCASVAEAAEKTHTL